MNDMNNEDLGRHDSGGELTEVFPKPKVTRDEMRQAVVDVMWAHAHAMTMAYGRTHALGTMDAGYRVPSAMDLMSERELKDLRNADFDLPAKEYGVTWNDVANTHLAETMEQLYDFAHFALFDPRYYPHELGDETSAWWIAMFVHDAASSQAFFFMSDLEGGTSLAAAHTLLEIIEIANARNILEGASETFVQDSNVDYLTIRQLALVSDFKEESLRVLANPKRKNALPTQSVSGRTVVGAEDARRWLQSKGRYTPVRAKPNSSGMLNLASSRFESPLVFCSALSDHISSLATQGEASQVMLKAVRKIYPNQYHQLATGVEGMVDAHLELDPADLHDTERLRALATALNLDPEMLVLKARESALRADLRQLEAQIRSQAETR